MSIAALLLWMAWAALVGALATVGVLFARGAFARRIEVTVDWSSIRDAVIAEGGIQVTPAQVIVDWRLIHQAVHGAGYQLIARHDEATGEPVRPH